jgi:peptidoglycan/xylan/chitin deacetylase (PgdA/CDA1 family)
VVALGRWKEQLMRERVRLVLATCFYYTGIVALAHWWIRRFRPRLIILNYHRARGENLRQQMRYLRRYYRVMHLEEALEQFYGTSRQQTDKRMPLVLTFDDGYRDNYSCAFALARELRVPITIFLIPGYIESGERFWWLEGKRLAYHAQAEKVTIEGQTYRLSIPEEQKALAQEIDRHLRHASSVAERETFLAQVRLAVGTSEALEQVDREALPLNWEQVREMERSGWVSFGAHTMHHPILSYLRDERELRQEVTECKSVLEQQLGHTVRTFAYPVGKAEHIGEAVIQAVKDAGYQWAVTTFEDVNTRQTNPYLLYRLPGDIEMHWLVLAAELVGLLGLSRLRRKYRAKFSG